MATKHETKTETAAQGIIKTSLPADYAAKVERYAALGAKVDRSKFKRLRGKSVVPANVNRGVASLGTAEMEARFHKELVGMKYGDLMELPDIVNVHDFLCTEVEKAKRNNEALLERLAKAEQMRSTLNPLLAAAVAQKIIPAGEVIAVKGGRGFYSRGKSLYEAARVLKAHYSELDGRLLVDEEYLDEATAAGIFMRDLGSDKMAMPQKKQASALEQLRDDVFALVAYRHDEMRRAGAYFYGSDVDQYVPALGSHKVVRHNSAANDNAAKADATTTTTPAAAPVATAAVVIPISEKQTAAVAA